MTNLLLHAPRCGVDRLGPTYCLRPLLHFVEQNDRLANEETFEHLESSMQAQRRFAVRGRDGGVIAPHPL